MHHRFQRLGGGDLLSPRLSPVADRPDRRLAFGKRLGAFLRRPRFRNSLFRALLGVATDRVRAARLDAAERRAKDGRIRSIRPGAVPLEGTRRVAIYIHYAPVPAVSRMVLAQVRAYRDLGFAVVFVSMSPGLPEAVLPELEACCALLVERRNHGLDFGAWHDILPEVLARAPGMAELLLVNDSLCGPFRALSPALEAMRAAPEGLYGLTENLAPAPHLQSYFLLARGEGVVKDVADFLLRHRVTANKRRTIREGEVRLSAWMRGRGHPVAAWCGYERVEAAALWSPVARRRVRMLYPSLFAGLAEDDAEGMRVALRQRPLNATHLFWRELVEDFSFPFVKTDLLLRNPLGIADELDWAGLLETETEVAVIGEHLSLLSGGRIRGPGREGTGGAA